MCKPVLILQCAEDCVFSVSAAITQFIPNLKQQLSAEGCLRYRNNSSSKTNRLLLHRFTAALF